MLNHEDISFLCIRYILYLNNYLLKKNKIPLIHIYSKGVYIFIILQKNELQVRNFDVMCKIMVRKQP